LLDIDDTLTSAKFKLVIVAEALVRATLEAARLELAATIETFAEESASLALNCTLVCALFASVRLKKAEDVTTLALDDTEVIVWLAASCADLMPFDADIDAACNCWENVALSLMIVLDISTVARSTDAAIRFAQSCGLFCRNSRLGGLVIIPFWGPVIDGANFDRINGGGL
jgi:hypothetical protein